MRKKANSSKPQGSSLEAPQASELNLRRVVDTVPGMVYQYCLMPDGTQRFLMVSKGCEALFGYPPEKIEQNFDLVWNQVLPEDIEKLKETITISATTLRTWRHEFRILKPTTNEVCWIRGQSIPEDPQPNGSITWNGILIDITEQKKLEAQLLQAQKMETVGALAGGIAHDLNNQLTPVKGYLHLLLQEIEMTSPMGKLLVEANQAADRCSEIIQQLLNYSRPAARTKTLIAPDSLLKEFQKLIRQFLPSTIEFDFSIPDQLWSIEGNSTELGTVLMNLAANAKDAMSQGGKLNIRAENIHLTTVPLKDCGEGDYLLITVSDTGEGMKPEILARIFEPFFTTKKISKGTGLGLAMVFKIIRDHQGWIDVSSAPQRGTTFRVYLPAKSGVAKPAAEIFAMKLENLISPHHETVLFADDEAPIRDLGRVLLEKLGYKVLLAADGPEALEVYERNKDNVRIVMLDMTMPKLTGVETLRRFLQSNPSLKVIVSSGFTETSFEELLNKGAAGFVQKPYSIYDLGQKIRDVLAAA